MSPTLCSSPHFPPAITSVARRAPPKSLRKAPHCRTCYLPRAGHPRHGCPYAEVSDEDIVANSPNLSKAPHSIHLGIHNVEQVVPHRIAKPHGANLASLSMDSSETSRCLVEPGMGVDPDEEAMEYEKVDEPKTPTKYPRKLKDSGTLNAPCSHTVRTEFSSSQVGTASHSLCVTGLPETSQVGSGCRAHPVSIEERSDFLDGVAKIAIAPPVTIYTVSLPEVFSIQQAATRIGLHTRVATPDPRSKETDVLLLVGTDVCFVEKLFDRLGQKAPESSGLRSVVGGAVMGAVAMFGGLIALS